MTEIEIDFSPIFNKLEIISAIKEYFYSDHEDFEPSCEALADRILEIMND